MLPEINNFIGGIMQMFGYTGIGAIVFAESGLLLGFILPGDSLIFLAGLLAAEGRFEIVTLCIVIIVAAIAGDNNGYLIGLKMGRRVFEKRNSFLFNQKNLVRTEEFFKRYGKLTFIIERYIPVIRLFAPLLAGVAKMPYRTFFIFNVIGVVLWTVPVTLLGYYLGAVVPDIERYLFPIILAIVVISLIPTFVTYRREQKRSRT